MKNRRNTRQNALNNAVNPLVELLESRQLLSSSLDTTTKELTITGTSGADDITVLRVGSDYKVGFNGDLEIYAVSEIGSIKINSLAGDDHIAMNSAIYCPVTIDAGDGLVESNILNLIGATGAEAFSILKPDVSQGETTDHFSTSYNTHSYSDIEKINVDTRGGWDTATFTSPIPISFTATQYFESLSISADAHVEVATGVNDLILSGPAKMIRVHSLFITGNAVFNLNDNILVIDYQDGPSPYDDVRNYITNGLGILGATGSGIDSNSVNVQATPGTMISLVDNGAIDGAINHVGSFNNIPFHSVLVTYTWFGDANLDGIVDGTDAALIDTGFIAGNVHEWIYGDIDYSNQVDNGDLGLYDTGFIAQSGAAIGIYKPAPTTVRAQKLWDSAIRVSWEAPPTTVQEYLIWASIDGGEYKLVAQPAATDNYFDYHFTEPHAASVSFRVSVRSENVVSKVVYALDVANPDIDNPVVIDQNPNTDPPPDYVDPGVPVNKEPVSPTTLTAKAIENNGLITLHWSDNSDNETGFIIYRSEDGQNFTELTRVGKDVTSYDDASVERGLRYYYKVAAYNDVGISDTTGPESAILKLQKPTGLQAVAPNDSEANLSWQDTSKHETGFLIQYKDTTVGGTYGNDLSVPVNATGWTIVGLISKHTYDFRIKAIGEAESDWFEKASATTTKSRFLNGGLYNTGVDNDNHALAGGAVDPHYGGLATFNNPGEWASGPWIGPVANQDECYAPASGTYDLQIDLTEMGVPPGGLSGSWSTDNSGQMKVNGVIPQKEGHNDPAFTTAYDGYGALHPFTIPASLLNAGSNTISFSFDSSSGDPNWGGAAGIVVVWDNMEDPGLSKVSITATDAEATEGKSDDKAKFTVKREGGDQTQALDVKIHVPAGTALSTGTGKDYTTDPTGIATVTIPANQDHVDITLTALADDKIESDETAILCLKADAAYRLAAAYSAEVMIKDGPTIDLDIDSNNDGNIDPNNESNGKDDPIEADNQKPGLVLSVNNDDSDQDGVGDFIDGYDWNNSANSDSDDWSNRDSFAPVKLKIVGVDIAVAKIKFDYKKSNPLSVVSSNNGPELPESGLFRLWKQKADFERNPLDLINGGDFIDKDKWYTPSQLGVSVNGESGLATLWLEAVKYSTSVESIKIILDPDGDGPENADCSDVANVSIYTTRYLQVDSVLGTSQETLNPVKAIPISHPTPVFNNEQIYASSLIFDANYESILATISVGFDLDDAYSDLLKGLKGVVSTASVFVNGNEISSGVLNLAVQKDNTYNNSLLKPHDFSASYSGVLSNVDVNPGWNVIKIAATNSAKQTAWTEYSFEVKLIGTLEDNATTYEGLTLDIGIDSIIKSTVSGSLKPIAVELVGPEVFLKDIDKVVVGSAFAERDVMIRDGRYLLGADINGTMIPDTFVALAGTFSSESESGTAVKPPILAPWDENYKNPESFTDGFFDGFEAYFVDIKDDLSGAWESVKKSGKWVIDNPETTFELITGAATTKAMVNLGIKTWQNRNVIISESKRAIDMAWNSAAALGPLISDYINNPEETLMKIADGTSAHLDALPDQVRTALEYSVEIISALSDEIQNLSKYDQGWYTGYAVTTVLSEVLQFGVGLATGGGSTVATLPMKSEKLAKVLVKLNQFGGKFAAAATKLTGFAADLATTKMCFVAGTPVWTDHGLVPIEQIRAGDMVLSRNGVTGEQTYKPVVDTITTHPDALYTITYDPDGSGPQPSDLIVTTAPHPFYVEGKGFVEAANLRVGDELHLACGDLANVQSITIRNAIPGVQFTTYNFEVAEFHTYFVDEAGVWVHNSGGGHCEKMFSLYQRFRDRAPATENSYETLIRIKQRMSASIDKIPSKIWRKSAKQASDEIFADVAAGNIPYSKIPSYNDWKREFNGLGSMPSTADDIHVHHSVEKWMQQRLGIVGDPNDVPGYLMLGADHTPSVGSLANRLSNEIRLANITDPLAITTKMRDIYVSEGLDDLWKVSKMWLNDKGIPTP